MPTKLASGLCLVALAFAVGGCGSATTRTTAWSPRYYPAPDNVIASKCDVAICDSHTSMAASKL
jgi:ABC-type uncharacterized transport system auxiliary subunit